MELMIRVDSDHFVLANRIHLLSPVHEEVKTCSKPSKVPQSVGECDWSLRLDSGGNLNEMRWRSIRYESQCEGFDGHNAGKTDDPDRLVRSFGGCQSKYPRLHTA